MYIEFSLPSGSAGQSAYAALLLIRKELAAWSSKYNIQYTSKTIKYKYRVCFDNDKLYALFALTWASDKHPWLSNYHIVSDLNNRT